MCQTLFFTQNGTYSSIFWIKHRHKVSQSVDKISRFFYFVLLYNNPKVNSNQNNL